MVRQVTALFIVARVLKRALSRGTRSFSSTWFFFSRTGKRFCQNSETRRFRKDAGREPSQTTSLTSNIRYSLTFFLTVYTCPTFTIRTGIKVLGTFFSTLGVVEIGQSAEKGSHPPPVRVDAPHGASVMALGEPCDLWRKYFHHVVNWFSVGQAIIGSHSMIQIFQLEVL